VSLTFLSPLPKNANENGQVEPLPVPIYKSLGYFDSHLTSKTPTTMTLFTEAKPEKPYHAKGYAGSLPNFTTVGRCCIMSIAEAVSHQFTEVVSEMLVSFVRCYIQNAVLSPHFATVLLVRDLEMRLSLPSVNPL
jgi:hypothetical protein